jgi:ABC-type polysaccharide/polyol phosphate export permease
MLNSLALLDLEIRQIRRFPLGFASRYGKLFIQCAAVFFLIESLGRSRFVNVEHHAVDVRFFLLSGFLAVKLLQAPMHAFDDVVGELRASRQLAYVLSGPTSLWTFYAVKLSWYAFLAATEIGFAAVLCALWGIDFSPLVDRVSIAAYALMFLAYAGIGMALSGIHLFLRTGRAFAAGVRQASIFLGGVFFPREILPPALRAAGDLFPISHCLDLVRSADGAAPPGSAGALAVAAALALGAGYFSLRWLLNASRRYGSLWLQGLA